MRSESVFLDEDWQPKRSEPSCPWPIDRGHLARYTLGDAALEREVLQLFTGEAPQRIEALRRARTEKEWKMAAHTLKGSARAVGAWRVGQLAQEAERLCHLADSDASADVIERLAQALAEAEDYIAGLYAEGQSELKQPA